MVGAFDGEQQVGCAGAYTFRLTVPGGEVGAAGVTIVGVLPTHTRRGILRQMMTWLVAQARERGEPVAILGASEAAIYQRFGYGVATQRSEFELETTAGQVPATRSRPPARSGTSTRTRRRDVFPVVYDAMHDGRRARWRAATSAGAGAWPTTPSGCSTGAAPSRWSCSRWTASRGPTRSIGSRRTGTTEVRATRCPCSS